MEMVNCFQHIFRSDTSRSELAELSKQANPDEIDIDDDDEDDDDDEAQGPEGECPPQYAQIQQLNRNIWCFICFFSTHVLTMFSSLTLQRSNSNRRVSPQRSLGVSKMIEFFSPHHPLHWFPMLRLNCQSRKTEHIFSLCFVLYYTRVWACIEICL